MKRFSPALLILLFASNAEAAVLFCRAEVDESSHYELRITIGASGETRGPLNFSYHTEDGLDLRAELAVRQATFAPGLPVRLEAANENMRVTASAPALAELFNGELSVYFSLDGAESVEAEISCTYR